MSRDITQALVNKLLEDLGYRLAATHGIGGATRNARLLGEAWRERINLIVASARAEAFTEISEGHNHERA